MNACAVLLAGILVPVFIAQADAAPEATIIQETMPDGCRLDRFTVHSDSMGREIRAVVVVPPGYADGEERYPVLHTLHGRGAPHDTWSQMSPLRRALRRRAMIVTCFDGDDASMYIDSTIRPDSQFTTFFFDEFVPYVDRHYRTTGKKAVTGFSMGGYGAFHYMLTRPEAFVSVSSLSGAFSYGGDRGDGRRGLSALLGDYEENKQAYLDCGIYNRMTDTIESGGTLPPLMFHCGTEDFLLERNREMRDFLVEQNRKTREQQAGSKGEDGERPAAGSAEGPKRQIVQFMYSESLGAHNWAFWRDASENVVDFHWRHFREQP